jgi:GDP-4-dehydro-6-deoxy-D-mannose reductase
MKVLVTGGGGFAGSHLIDYLLTQGQQVAALVRPGSTLANLAHVLRQVEVQRADIRDAGAVLEVLKRTRPGRIYHLASLSTKVEFSDQPWIAYEVILKGTMNLLCAWRDLQIDSRLLFVSSAEVYGAAGGDAMPLREDQPFRPASPYAASKAAAELFALQFFQSYKLPTVRVRPFQHTGPRQLPSFVCSSLARQAAEIEKAARPGTIRVGNTEARRDFTDVRDIVQGYHLLMEKGQPGEVYQLCSDRAVSIGQVLQKLVPLTGQQVDIAVDESRLRRPPETSVVWGDSTKARLAVGWEPRIPLETTLRDLKLYWDQVLARPATADHV